MDSSPVAGLDKKLDVCIHKWNRHCHGSTVGKDEVGVLAETLDSAENVVPATAVQT